MKGFNSRFDPVQAAVLRVLAEWNERHSGLAQQYLEGLAESGLVLPQVPDWAEPVWHLFVVRHPERVALVKRLNEAGQGTLNHYPVPPHLKEAYVEMGFGVGAFPIAERMAGEVVSLPMGGQLAPECVEVICEVCRGYNT